MPLFEEINNGGIEAMMWDLMERPLNNWDPQAFPMTKALIKAETAHASGLRQGV